MTTRERKQRKLEKRREWAESRDRKAASAHERARAATEGIPMGQPILVGHHSERKHRAALRRHDAAMDRAVESSNMADRHRSKAAGLAAQLNRDIYDDDPDAIECLEERIAEREQTAADWKAINRAWRKGGAAALAGLELPSGHVCSERIAATCERTMSMAPWLKSPLDTTGLRASIRRDRERIDRIKKQQERAARAESAGGVLIERIHDRWATVTFDEKPEREVLTDLKAAGFRWAKGSWVGEHEKIPTSVIELAGD